MPTPDRSPAQGRWGESACADYLSGKGHKILQKNYKRFPGEVDIISMDGDCLVCTEVKTWTWLPPEDLARAVSLSKQRRIIRTAQVFLLENPQFDDTPVRFDVVLLGLHSGIHHYQDAFQGAD